MWFNYILTIRYKNLIKTKFQEKVEKVTRLENFCARTDENKLRKDFNSYNFFPDYDSIERLRSAIETHISKFKIEISFLVSIQEEIWRFVFF